MLYEYEFLCLGIEDGLKICFLKPRILTVFLFSDSSSEDRLNPRKLKTKLVLNINFTSLSHLNCMQLAKIISSCCLEGLLCILDRYRCIEILVPLVSICALVFVLHLSLPFPSIYLLFLFFVLIN